MVSFGGRQHRPSRLGIRRQSSCLSIANRLIVFILAVWFGISVQAQGSTTVLVELATVTFDDEALFHLRVPRGQTIEQVTLSQDELFVDLDVDILPLEETQFILLDASDSMVNLQQVVQANVSRLWQTDDQETSLIFYALESSVLSPTNRTEDIDNFLAGYNSNPSDPACLADAISQFDAPMFIRDYDRSWRILVITVGDFSGTANCVTDTLQSAPSAVDVISITGDIDPDLQDWVDRSGGRFYTANLRSIEARINEVITEFGNLTYAVEGALPDEWNRESSFELEIEFSNGVEEAQILSFRDYNVPVPATPTPLPTETETPIVATDVSAEATDGTEVGVIAVVTETTQTTSPETTTPPVSSSNNGVAVLLIVAAILFVVGAVVVALALSRVRRRPADPLPATNDANFYETLSGNEPRQDDSLTSTRVRERDIVSPSVDEPITRITSLDDTFIDDSLVEEESDDNDNLLVTQVLSDARFQNMMEQSQTNDEVIGWLRLISTQQDEHQDFELTRRGVVVGRSQDCDIQITGDRAISRQHARLDVRTNDQVTVSRLSAVNHVIVGGVQVSNRHPLQPNDVIYLSDETRLIFIARSEDAEMDDTQI